MNGHRASMNDGPPDTGIPTIPQLAAQANVHLQPNARVGRYDAAAVLWAAAFDATGYHTEHALPIRDPGTIARMHDAATSKSSTLHANDAAASAVSTIPAKSIRSLKFQLPPTKPGCAKESPEGDTENRSDRRLHVHRSLGTTLEMSAHRCHCYWLASRCSEKKAARIDSFPQTRRRDEWG
jgi:hypothetical protein